MPITYIECAKFFTNLKCDSPKHNVNSKSEAIAECKVTSVKVKPTTKKYSKLMLSVSVYILEHD